MVSGVGARFASWGRGLQDFRVCKVSSPNRAVWSAVSFPYNGTRN